MRMFVHSQSGGNVENSERVLQFLKSQGDKWAQMQMLQKHALEQCPYAIEVCALDNIISEYESGNLEPASEYIKEFCEFSAENAELANELLRLL